MFGGLLRRRILPPRSHQVLQTSQIHLQDMRASSLSLFFGELVAEAPQLVSGAVLPSPSLLAALVEDALVSSVLVAPEAAPRQRAEL